MKHNNANQRENGQNIAMRDVPRSTDERENGQDIAVRNATTPSERADHIRSKNTR